MHYLEEAERGNPKCQANVCLAFVLTYCNFHARLSTHDNLSLPSVSVVEADVMGTHDNLSLPSVSVGEADVLQQFRQPEFYLVFLKT